MIQNIEKYARARGFSGQDALQVFMQVVALKNLLTRGAALIGGTALVIGYGNPRFSEDVDLAGVEDPASLKANLDRAAEEIGGLLGAKMTITSPKTGRATWRLRCETGAGASAQLHVDTQKYRPLTHHPVMVAYPGVPPFVFPSVGLGEIMADKLIALAFRNYASGRGIFDLWFHWLKGGLPPETEQTIFHLVNEKLVSRRLRRDEFLKRLNARMSHGIPVRVKDEWERYLPATLKERTLYESIFASVQTGLHGIKL